MDYCIQADWPAPAQIKACTTLRHPGCSQAPYDSWNLATHVNDSAAHVAQNRALLTERLALPTQPVWLEQVHGIDMLSLDELDANAVPRADGSYTRSQNRVCAVLTADCLPLLICNREGSEVAAVHAGWRGLAAGVLESALQCFQADSQDLLVWLGPAIGAQAFEVGEEVLQAFEQRDPHAGQAFIAGQENKYLADIYQLARQRLQRSGVSAVYGGGHCTFTESSRFYSYRRAANTGRMASLIWIEA
jgi:YfiH family protein